MGLTIYRKVTNVLEVPANVLVHFIGLGLKVRRMTDAERAERNDLFFLSDTKKGLSNKEKDKKKDNAAIKIDVDLGDGLKFTDSGSIVLDLGEGLSLDGESKLRVNAGGLLHFDSEGNITVNIGEGLMEDKDGRLTVDPDWICDQIGMDNTPSLEHSQEVQVQVGSKMTLEGNLLSLIKDYQKYTLVRNKLGRILDVVPGDMTTETDEVSISSGYGYGGYGIKPLSNNRTDEQDTPNFYSK